MRALQSQYGLERKIGSATTHPIPKPLSLFPRNASCSTIFDSCGLHVVDVSQHNRAKKNRNTTNS